ncbi:MAG: cell division protein ZipA [Rudaea sp.]|nr:cell division protein ZipA [Rudaea sp.]
MESQGLSTNELRIIIAVIGAVIFGLIYFFGRPSKKGQGKRTLFQRGGERVEPTLDGNAEPAQGELDVDMHAELERLGSAIVAKRSEGAADTGQADEPVQHKGPRPGARPALPIERIVTLFVAARDGEFMHGSNLVVAAEKAGLMFGDMGIFHRLVSGKSEAGPVFSMANMIKPGSFDMRHIDELQTPGVSFFMALPGPLSALDAWDAMLPTAHRLAELLDANVLDEERNALGRQRVAHIRDELRAYDRKQERNQIRMR